MSKEKNKPAIEARQEANRAWQRVGELEEQRTRLRIALFDAANELIQTGTSAAALRAMLVLKGAE